MAHETPVKTFKLFDVEWTVYESKSIDEGEAHGVTRMDTHTIKIAKSSTDQMKEITLWHEVMHAIFGTLGYEKLTSNEQLVDQVGMALHQVLKTMKDIKD